MDIDLTGGIIIEKYKPQAQNMEKENTQETTCTCETQHHLLFSVYLRSHRAKNEPHQ